MTFQASHGISVTVPREEGAVHRRLTPGPALYHLSVIPDAPRAIVGLLHGYADHAGRYAHVMEAWAEAGIGAIALDMRGHGRAAGARGVCSRFDEYLDDAAELAELVAARAAGAPTFLFGHSFGGLVAIRSAMAAPQPWKGIVLSGPYLDLALPVPAVKRIAGQVASRLAPGLSFRTGLRGAHVTHDPAQAHGYDTDPLVFKHANARWFTEAVAAQRKARDQAGTLSLPLTVVVGGADPVANVAASRAFFDAAGSLDKTWDERPGLFHEVVNETEWKTIAASLADWMLERAGADSGGMRRRG